MLTRKKDVKCFVSLRSEMGREYLRKLESQGRADELRLISTKMSETETLSKKVLNKVSSLVHTLRLDHLFYHHNNFRNGSL